MADFFTRLSERTLGYARVAQPLIASRFASWYPIASGVPLDFPQVPSVPSNVVTAKFRETRESGFAPEHRTQPGTEEAESPSSAIAPKVRHQLADTLSPPDDSLESDIEKQDQRPSLPQDAPSGTEPRTLEHFMPHVRLLEPGRAKSGPTEFVESLPSKGKSGSKTSETFASITPLVSSEDSRVREDSTRAFLSTAKPLVKEQHSPISPGKCSAEVSKNLSESRKAFGTPHEPSQAPQPLLETTLKQQDGLLQPPSQDAASAAKPMASLHPMLNDRLLATGRAQSGPMGPVETRPSNGKISSQPSGTFAPIRPLVPSEDSHLPEGSTGILLSAPKPSVKQERGSVSPSGPSVEAPSNVSESQKAFRTRPERRQASDRLQCTTLPQETSMPRVIQPKIAIHREPAKTMSEKAEMAFVEPSSPPPNIRVTIGRVEVRAIMPPEPKAPPAKPSRPGPALSLDDYLKQRNEGL